MQLTFEPSDSRDRRPPTETQTKAVPEHTWLTEKRSLMQSDVLAMQRSLGNAAVARLLNSDSGFNPSASGGFPHQRIIEERFGQRLPGSAVLDPSGCRSQETEAFTDGDCTHFADSEPRLEVAVHEATHQLQHAGMTNDNGMGAEGQAHEVAHRVSTGRSARDLLGPGGEVVPRALRRYTEIPVARQSPVEWDAGGVPVRVSDDGAMAVAQDSRAGSQRLWAHPAFIAASNAKLAAIKSVIRLKQGTGTITGSAPSRTAVLYSVEPENVANNTAATSMEIWADCGKSARDVIGVGAGTGKNYEKVTAEYQNEGVEVQTDASSPKEMADEIIKHTLGKHWYGDSVEDGWKGYRAMTPAQREDFDRVHGINKYVQMRVGGGLTMASGGASYSGVSTWNFHWAGVVMSNGNDHVTLENYSVSRPAVQNTRWKFQMYGPYTKTGQTFHEQHQATRQHGDMPTTMEVHQR